MTTPSTPMSCFPVTILPENDDKLQHLEELLIEIKKQNSLPTVMEQSSKAMGWVKQLIGVLGVVIALGIHWGVVTTKIGILEEKNRQMKLDHAEQISKLDNDVHELQLKQARDDELLRSMQGTLQEMSSDLKSLMKGD